jgi:hypothetical protein
VAVAPEDIRVLVPRVRRAVEGVGQPEALSDDNVKDLVADAIADVILFTGGVFGKELLVTARDSTNNAPTEYATSEPLTLPEGSVIAAQAALTAVWETVRELKVQETIRDEGQEWSYQLSRTLVKDRIAMLQAQRDKALAQLASTVPVAFVSFLHERDRLASTMLEPFYIGLEDPANYPTSYYR